MAWRERLEKSCWKLWCYTYLTYNLGQHRLPAFRGEGLVCPLEMFLLCKSKLGGGPCSTYLKCPKSHEGKKQTLTVSMHSVSFFSPIQNHEVLLHNRQRKAISGPISFVDCASNQNLVGEEIGVPANAYHLKVLPFNLVQTWTIVIYLLMLYCQEHNCNPNGFMTMSSTNFLHYRLFEIAAI